MEVYITDTSAGNIIFTAHVFSFGPKIVNNEAHELLNRIGVLKRHLEAIFCATLPHKQRLELYS